MFKKKKQNAVSAFPVSKTPRSKGELPKLGAVQLNKSEQKPRRETVTGRSRRKLTGQTGNDADYRTQIAEKDRQIAELQSQLAKQEQRFRLAAEHSEIKAVNTAKLAVAKSHADDLKQLKAKMSKQKVQTNHSHQKEVNRAADKLMKMRESFRKEIAGLKNSVGEKELAYAKKARAHDDLVAKIELLEENKKTHEAEARARADEFAIRLKKDGHSRQAVETLENIASNRIWNTEPRLKLPGRRRESVRAAEIRSALYASTLSETLKISVNAATEKAKQDMYARRMLQGTKFVTKPEWVCTICKSRNEEENTHCRACKRPRKKHKIRLPSFDN